MNDFIKKYKFFKTENDYKIPEFIYSIMEFRSNDEDYLNTENLIGKEGIIFVSIGRSPFQMILYELIGPNNCFIEHHSNPEKFNKLYLLLWERDREKYHIATKSPAKTPEAINFH